MSLRKLRARFSDIYRFALFSIGMIAFVFVLATFDVAAAQESPVRLPGVSEVEPVEQASFIEPGDFHRKLGECWSWQVLPKGLIYRSYLAGAKEPRFASVWVNDHQKRWLWELTMGARVGLLRYGNKDVLMPDGHQIDLEFAAMPRLDMQKHPNAEHSNDLVACDYRAGIQWTYGNGPWRTKFGYYHLSSHLGDEFMIRDPDVERINYSRDAVVLGISYYWTPNLRLYGETAAAINPSGGALPWEFQFGIDYSPISPTGLRPVPFFAINGHLREEVDFGGNMVVQTGIQWRGTDGHLLRLGLQYYNGMSDQFEFFNEYESKFGFGLWYDF